MRILITGGAGYIGSACTKKVLADGHDVVIIDSLVTGKESLLDERADFFKFDLAKDDISPAFAKPVDAVIHFAAYKAVEESMEDAVKYSDNIIGTTNLLNAMVKHEVKKIIFSSTAAVYGSPEYSPLDEKHPTNPENFYGQTKLMAESLLSWYHRIHGIQFVALRYFNVVGDMLGYLDPAPKNVVPIIMEAVIGKRDCFTIFGTEYDTPDGTCLRDYIDLHDLIDAHILALSFDGAEMFNLGTQSGTSVKELVALCKEVTGKDFEVKSAGPRKGDPASVVASFEKAKNLLGWEPKVSLKESLQATWNVYKN